MPARSFCRILFYFLLSFILFSCMTQSRFMSHATMNMASVPPGYNPKKHILLVEEMHRLYYPEQRSDAVTNKLDKALKENFPYRYEIVSAKDINENKSKYGDTSIYKYALLTNVSTITRTT